MKKKTVLIVVIVAMMLALAGCCLSHDWKPASCVAPVTCSKCGETEGEALGHIWKDATCTDSKTCNRCAETTGEALGHKWKDATCTEAQTCSVCGEVNGEPSAHKQGAWKKTKEPDGGKAGVQELSCTVCGEVIQQKDFFYPYFNMSFEEFMKKHNQEYRSDGWEIREVSTGFSYYMGGDEVAIVFHENLNTKKSGSITAYSKVKEEQFNTIKVRFIDHGGTYISTDYMDLISKLGLVAFRPLIGYDAGKQYDKFINMTVTRNTNTMKEGEVIIGNYKYVIGAYVINDTYSRVFYEFSCQTI